MDAWRKVAADLFIEGYSAEEIAARTPFTLTEVASMKAYLYSNYGHKRKSARDRRL